jgi:hypothetical protein
MNRSLIICVLLIGFTLPAASGFESTIEPPEPLPAGYRPDSAGPHLQSPYQRQETWYEFALKQFNPENVEYGNWIEEQRRRLIEVHLQNPYFQYSLWATIALLIATALCAKQWIDHRRAMWITAEMMADLYNQDAYSRQAAQEAINRYNQHVERCNRAIEVGDSNPATTRSHEIEQLRAELMRVVEERDAAIRDRDIARDDLRRKSEILADMSIRLDSAANKAGGSNMDRATSDSRSADAKLVTHINNLQEQLYAERSSNRRLRGE